MGLLDNIKQEAKGNRTKIQTSEVTDLEKILNNLFYLEKNAKMEPKFVQMVITRGMESQERTGLHASALIAGDKDYCARAQVLSLIYKQLQSENVNIGLKRIFEEGNAIHEKWQRLFIRGGFCTPNDLDVTKMNDKYRISYTPDIICRIPEFYDGEMVGEVKSVNTHQFRNMTAHPSGGKQLQFYMFLTGIHKGFVLSEDKNTQEFKLELYDYESEKTSKFVDRAEEVKYWFNKVHKEGKMIPRPIDRVSYECKGCTKCNMKDACWNRPGGKVLL